MDKDRENTMARDMLIVLFQILAKHLANKQKEMHKYKSKDRSYKHAISSRLTDIILFGFYSGT